MSELLHSVGISFCANTMYVNYVLHRFIVVKDIAGDIISVLN